MTGLNDIFGNLDWTYLLDILRKIIPAFVCVVLHEMAHGFSAYLLGDDTAKRSGRLLLNPIKHIDPFGLIMMATVGFGWAKPVPVNMRRFKRPKQHMAITALAGPVCNFLIAFVCLMLLNSSGSALSKSSFGREVYTLLLNTAYLSIGLGLFNLIPIPPLDGSKVFFSLLSDKNYIQLMRYERYGLILCLLLVVSDVVNQPLNTAATWVFNNMSGISVQALKFLSPIFMLLG